MEQPAQQESEMEAGAAIQIRGTRLKKYLLLITALTLFTTLFLIKFLNPYSSPVSAVEILIGGILESRQDILLNEHFLFSNELTDRYGEEVHHAWLAVDREGKAILERARMFVRNKGKEKFNLLNKTRREDIEQQSFREYVTSAAYSAVKLRIADLPDSLVFTDPHRKNEYVHEQGLRLLPGPEQTVIGKTLRTAFIDSQDAFIRRETVQGGARQAKKKFSRILKLYDQIEKAGMVRFDNFFEILEKEADDDFSSLPLQQQNEIRSRSYLRYVYEQGYETAMTEIRNGTADRYQLGKFSHEIFMNEEKAMQYRYETGLKAVPASKSALLKPFDYTIGLKVSSGLQSFIREAGLIRLFEFIGNQTSRESFTVTTVSYRSYETSLFYSHIAEVESNIGTFIMHQRNGEWYMADYR